MAKRLTNLWKMFWLDQDGQIAIWQTPNVPLISWSVFLILSKLLPAGNLHNGFAFVSTASILVWAYLEIVSGRSYFRRLLGLIIMLGIVITYFK